MHKLTKSITTITYSDSSADSDNYTVFHAIGTLIILPFAVLLAMPFVLFDKLKRHAQIR